MDPVQVGEKQTGSGSELESTAIQSTLHGQQRSSLAPVPVEGGNPNSGTSPVANKLTPRAGISGAHASATAGAAAAALTRVADEVARALDDLVKQDLVVMRRSEFWIEVEIKTDILFPSGRAQPAPNAIDVLQRLGNALAPYPNPIRVEGHTDNKPIKTVAFYSNWELSAARAGSVVRVLQSRGVNPERLAVIGYGEQRPVQSNDTEQGRNANRRVVVVILSTDLQHHSDPADQPGSLSPIPPSAATAAAEPDAAAATVPAVPVAAQAPIATPGEPAALPTATAAPAPANVTLSTSGAHVAGNGMVPAP
jgi:chemotaxis protein MotB